MRRSERNALFGLQAGSFTQDSIRSAVRCAAESRGRCAPFGGGRQGAHGDARRHGRTSDEERRPRNGQQQDGRDYDIYPPVPIVPLECDLEFQEGPVLKIIPVLEVGAGGVVKLVN